MQNTKIANKNKHKKTSKKKKNRQTMNTIMLTKKVSIYHKIQVNPLILNWGKSPFFVDEHGKVEDKA